VGRTLEANHITMSEAISGQVSNGGVSNKVTR
jgi:hypothetical protein